MRIHHMGGYKLMNSDTAKTTLLCALALACVLGLNYVLFRVYVDVRLDMRTAWIASADIPPRTVIDEADLTEVRIPGAYLIDHACTDRNEIIGKITEIQGMIPAGSVFYKSMLKDPDTIPDRSAGQLRTGQSLYTVRPDSTSLTSLTAGMRVDVHFTVERKNEPPLTGCLIRHARIVSVRDHKGLSTDDPSGTGIPYMAELAVNTDDLEMLTMAETCGTLRLFTSSETYRTDLEAQADTQSPVWLWLAKQMPSGKNQ